MSYAIGKCPHCGALLYAEDIRDIDFRGMIISHTAYVCTKCNTIIGFGETNVN